jgi:hypothetical protein
VTTVIGIIAAILIGTAGAGGVVYAVNQAAAPDKGLNLDDPVEPDPWVDFVDYGKRTSNG